MHDGWRTASVDEICETVSVGIVVQPSQYYVEDAVGVRAFRSANVGENRVVDANWVYLSAEGHRLNSKSALREGDVLIVRTGAPGAACVLPADYDGSNCIDIVFARPKRRAVLPDYLAAYTNSDVGRRHVLGNQGGLAQKHLNVGAYKRLPVLLPPIPEQRKIVEILRTWDEALEKLEALRAAEEKVGAAMSRRCFEPCHSDTIARPAGWRPYLLGDVFTERDQPGVEDDRLLSITMNGGVIDRDDVGRRDTSKDDKSAYKLIIPGDIGYNTMRMWQGVSGLSRLRGIVSPAYTIVTPRLDRIDPAYAAHLFKSRRMVFDFERYSQGLTSDTWNLKFPAFSRIKVFLPSLNLQRRHAEMFDTIQQEIDLLSRQIDALARQKRGLMQKLLTGEWRVTGRG